MCFLIYEINKTMRKTEHRCIIETNDAQREKSESSGFGLFKVRKKTGSSEKSGSAINP